MRLVLDDPPGEVTVIAGPIAGLPVLTADWCRRQLGRALPARGELEIVGLSSGETAAGWRFDRVDAVVRVDGAPQTWRAGLIFYLHRQAWSVTLSAPTPIADREDVRRFVCSARLHVGGEIVALAHLFPDPPPDV